LLCGSAKLQKQLGDCVLVEGLGALLSVNDNGANVTVDLLGASSKDLLFGCLYTSLDLLLLVFEKSVSVSERS
jgi:hypothetical protein